MNVTLFTGLHTAAFREWGFHPERCTWPLVVFTPVDDDFDLHAEENETLTRIPSFSSAEGGITDIAFRARHCIDSGLAGEYLYYINPELPVEQFSLDMFETGLLHQYLRDQHPGLCSISQIGSGRKSDVFGGHVDQWIQWLDALDQFADPQSPVNGFSEIPQLQLNLNTEVLKYSGRQVVHILGDSHSLYSFSEFGKVGRRNPAVQFVNDVTLASGDSICLSIDHIGPHTMHHFAHPEHLNTAMLQKAGLRDGDSLMLVCGEIDVRNHIHRIATRKKQPYTEIIRELTTRYLNHIAEIKKDFPGCRFIIAAPTPPLNFEELNQDPPEHAGSLEERVTYTAAMVNMLEQGCKKHGFTLLDYRNHYANPDGVLYTTFSDMFCHISPYHNHCARQVLFDILR